MRENLKLPVGIDDLKKIRNQRKDFLHKLSHDNIKRKRKGAVKSSLSCNRIN